MEPVYQNIHGDIFHGCSSCVRNHTAILHVNVQDNPDYEADHKRDGRDAQAYCRHLGEPSPELEILSYRYVECEQEYHRYSSHQGEHQGQVRTGQDQEGQDEQRNRHNIRKTGVD